MLVIQNTAYTSLRLFTSCNTSANHSCGWSLSWFIPAFNHWTLRLHRHRDVCLLALTPVLKQINLLNDGPHPPPSWVTILFCTSSDSHWIKRNEIYAILSSVCLLHWAELFYQLIRPCNEWCLQWVMILWCCILLSARVRVWHYSKATVSLLSLIIGQCPYARLLDVSKIRRRTARVLPHQV